MRIYRDTYIDDDDQKWHEIGLREDSIGTKLQPKICLKSGGNHIDKIRWMGELELCCRFYEHITI